MKCGAIAGLLLPAASRRADDYSDLFRSAAVYAEQRNYDAAIAKYRAALAIRPDAPEALNNLAVMYYQQQRYSDAFGAASQIWQKHPELKSAALITGMSAVQCNRPKDAIAPLNKLLDSDPHNRDARLALASAHVALHDFPEAARIYESQIADVPEDLTAWYGRAICYESMAEAASKKLSQMPGGGAYSKRLLAEYLQMSGDERLAREAFGEAEAAASQSSDEAVKQYEVARGLADKSRQAFERLLQIAPDSWQASVFLGDVDRQHGDLSSALTRYKKAASLAPGNPAPLLGLGTTYWELGDFDEAAQYLHQTLVLNPDAAQAVFELANIAVRKHSDTEAVQLLKRYLAVQPDAYAAHADLGRAYSHLGQYAEAVPELRKAAASDERGDIHYELSLALKKLGQNSEADVALKESAAIRRTQLNREQKRHSAQ